MAVCVREEGELKSTRNLSALLLMMREKLYMSQVHSHAMNNFTKSCYDTLEYKKKHPLFLSLEESLEELNNL